ncbi:flagellar assembly protein FliW [Chitinibacter fontanus]|uniref:Flagellar assembly factor FliW n=1 Tax=Chitinibacter fontanus TaxID=1737446 RepID=A0A7D5V813_9NEIS|nr:flagellar assembly protein FliW [Chitinibacter fontanus]QLI80415.1 flagellar assembly protein FliW [Chitinibacter fontanus]
MDVFQSQFGPIEVDPDTIIHFPAGLPGFDDCKNYKLLHEEKPNPSVYWLQSLDDASVAFSIVGAEHLGFNYVLALDDDECASIDLTDPNEAMLFLILSRPENEAIRANTMAPLVLNLRSRKGLQKIGLKANIVFSNT